MDTPISQYKHIFLRCLCILVLLVFMCAYNTWAGGLEDEYNEAKAAAVRAAGGQFPVDGVFEGSAVGYGGDVVVSVTIEEGFIEDVSIVSAKDEDAAWLKEAIVLLDQIVVEQTPAIDVVTGATYTSTGILNATKNAIASSLG